MNIQRKVTRRFLVFLISLTLFIGSSEISASSNEITSETVRPIISARDEAAFQCPGAPFILPSGNYMSAGYFYCRGADQCAHPELGFHQGIDIKQYENGSPVNTPGVVPVYAAYAGTVILDPGHGNAPRWLDIRHSNVNGQPVVYSFYTHLANTDCSQSYILVNDGQWVEQGQLIAYQGNCGAQSVHLHFSVNYPELNEYYNNQDPSPFLGMNVNGNNGAPAGYLTSRCYTGNINDFNGDGKQDIYGVLKAGSGSGMTEVHVLNGANNFQSFLINIPTVHHSTETDGTWVYNLGDYNRDGKRDLYAINKATGASGTTEVHILDGSNQFQSYLLNTGTVLHRTGSDNSWEFNLGDYNNDGNLDLYAVNKYTGSSGMTEVHVLNGANNFQSFLLNKATILHLTGSDGSWTFSLGDFNGDSKPDLYAINKATGNSGTTEVHILNGANEFQSFLLNTATGLHPTGSDDSWEFNIGNYNVDGKLDIYAINKAGSTSGKTEIHVLNGADNFQSFLAHEASALHVTGFDCQWNFITGQCGYKQTHLYIPMVFNYYRPFIRLSLQTDPSGDWISPTPRAASMDIRQTSVWLINSNYLRFEMQLEGAIPATSSSWRFYGWFLDTDLNSGTGQQYNDIGSDYNVQITYFPERGWVGQIFDIRNSGLIELNSITVTGNTVKFIVPLNTIGSPKVFNWISIDQDDAQYYADKTPNTGHIHTALPSK